MLKYLLTQGLFKIAMLLAFFAFIGVFFFAAWLETDNVPPEGMRMPVEAAAAFGKPSIAAHENALAVQNLSVRDLAKTLSDVVAETLSFDKSNFAYNAGAMRKYFTREGYAQYRQFLTSAGFEKSLMEQNMRASAYAEEDPRELSSGLYNGAYKWFFEVPVTISFTPGNAQDAGESVSQAQNKRMTLRVQWTRVKDAEDPNAVKIEIWQVLPPRRGQ